MRERAYKLRVSGANSCVDVVQSPVISYVTVTDGVRSEARGFEEFKAIRDREMEVSWDQFVKTFPNLA